MAQISLGYNQPDESAIEIVQITLNDKILAMKSLENPDEIDLTGWWTPEVPLSISVRYKVDEAQIREGSALWANDGLYCNLVSYCPASKIQFTNDPVPTHAGVNELLLEIPSLTLSDILKLKLELFVNFDQGAERKIGSPSLPFSRLLTKGFTFSLSGVDSLANVQVTDFSGHGRQKDAMWRISFNLSLDLEEWEILQVSNVIQIEVNRDLPAEYLSDGRFLVALMTDVVALTIDQFMHDEEKLDLLRNFSSASYSGSWLLFAHSYFEWLFPVHELVVTKAWLRNQSKYRAEIQSIVSSGIDEKLASIEEVGN